MVVSNCIGDNAISCCRYGAPLCYFLFPTNRHSREIQTRQYRDNDIARGARTRRNFDQGMTNGELTGLTHLSYIDHARFKKNIRSAHVPGTVLTPAYTPTDDVLSTAKTIIFRRPDFFGHALQRHCFIRNSKSCILYDMAPAEHFAVLFSACCCLPAREPSRARW